MAELNKLTLSEARDVLRKELTSLELTQSCITAIEEGKA